jgi:hypothetical protein
MSHIKCKIFHASGNDAITIKSLRRIFINRYRLRVSPGVGCKEDVVNVCKSVHFGDVW